MATLGHPSVIDPQRTEDGRAGVPILQRLAGSAHELDHLIVQSTRDVIWRVVFDVFRLAEFAGPFSGGNLTRCMSVEEAVTLGLVHKLA